MQVIDRPTILTKTPLLFNKAIRHLLTTSAPVLPQVKLLTPQPLFQRRLFIKWAITDHLHVFFQLMPTTRAGHPVNVTGQVKKYGDDHFLITSKNTFYLVKMDQIRYIANL